MWFFIGTLLLVWLVIVAGLIFLWFEMDRDEPSRLMKWLDEDE